jgi:hypothetical protein
MTGKSFVKALHLWIQSVFINIDSNSTALFNQIKNIWRNIREYRKANQMFQINFVNHEILLKIKTGYIQTDEGVVNTQYKRNKKQRWERMRLIFMDG